MAVLRAERLAMHVEIGQVAVQNAVKVRQQTDVDQATGNLVLKLPVEFMLNDVVRPEARGRTAASSQSANFRTATAFVAHRCCGWRSPRSAASRPNGPGDPYADPGATPGSAPLARRARRAGTRSLPAGRCLPRSDP